jgi:hypothetical protein
VKRLALLAVVYSCAALAVASCWTFAARSEWYANRYNSIVAIADGSAPAPFVQRRLVCDTARALAAVVPESTWQQVTDFLAGNPRLTALLRDRLCWRAEDYPLLLSATLLIWLSVVGFMFVCRWIAQTVYESPPWLADLAGLVLGLAFLGAGTAYRHYQWYPYDYPNAFVFALVLGAQLARRPWAVVAFALAAYSKETSLLLIVSYVLLEPEGRGRRYWSTLAAMSLMFLGCRLWLALAYDSPPGGDFWYPWRNSVFILRNLALDFWPLPLLFVALWRFAACWPTFPRSLRTLLVLLVIQASLSFFKGWIEEKRQYLELVPIVGLLLMQWVLTEVGHGRLMVPRDLVSAEPETCSVADRIRVSDARCGIAEAIGPT